MANKIIRRHTTRKNDGKGLRRMVAGKRFRLPADIDSREADRRFGWIEELWLDNETFCRKIGREVIWTDIALWAAELLRKGERRLPLPPVDDILPSYEGGEWPYRIQCFVDRYTDERAACHYPPTVDQCDDWMLAKDIFDVICGAFPSVPWILPEVHRLTGTLPYMAPEQLGDEPAKGYARTDIWSLGVVLYELLTSKLPFDDPSPAKLCEQIRSHVPLPPRGIN